MERPSVRGAGVHVVWRNATYPHAPRLPPLRRDDVHVWCARLRTPASVERRLWQTLDADERSRAARLLARDARTRYIASHGLLRHVLGAYLTTSPDRVRYRYTPRGQPQIVRPRGAPPIEFSLSHSAELALFAVAFGRPIGVDVEEIRADRDVVGLAARFFSAAESAVLTALAPEDRVDAFYRAWTRKEAYVKARGEGLSVPLDSFDVSLAPGVPAALLRSSRGPAEVRRWDVVGVAPAPGYAAAVVVGAGIARIIGWKLEISGGRPAPRRLQAPDSVAR
jgi:4'-phosphopantetheinyl transferase